MPFVCQDCWAELESPATPHTLADCRQGWSRLRTDNNRLRAALTEMLESFTEPEDDNDILRRARAALA